MRKLTKEDIGNAIYGELSIKERKEIVCHTIKKMYVFLKDDEFKDRWELIKAPCNFIVEIIKTIEKEEENAKKKG